MSPDSIAASSKSRDKRAFNAYRHGLAGQVLIIPPSEQAAYRKHCAGILQSLAPQGALETDLAQSVADDRWRLNRAAAIENNIFATGLAEPDKLRTGHPESDTAMATARVFVERSRELDRLTLYESRIQRKIDKNLAHLRQLQQDRRDDFEKLAAQAAILGDSCELPPEAQSPRFVHSPAAIRRLAQHFRRLNSPSAGPKIAFQPPSPRARVS